MKSISSGVRPTSRWFTQTSAPGGVLEMRRVLRTHPLVATQVEARKAVRGWVQTEPTTQSIASACALTPVLMAAPVPMLG